LLCLIKSVVLVENEYLAVALTLFGSLESI